MNVKLYLIEKCNHNCTYFKGIYSDFVGHEVSSPSNY